MSPPANANWFPTIGPEANSNTTAAIAMILKDMVVFELITAWYMQYDNKHNDEFHLWMPELVFDSNFIIK
ncbi:MAG: hypothetical protein WCF23_16210 [Candidatus Nitrosopolaris sp.]